MDEQPIQADTPEEMIVRSFSAELTPGDGRTVDVRIVPYGERITHNDGMGDVPRGVEYQEEWLPGVFAHQVNAANRVHANFEHQAGVAGVVGHGVALRDERDGFHGSFRILNTAAGDTTLELIHGGGLDSVSLEAMPVKNIKNGNIVQRAKANLRAIAFTRFGAYAGARVLAVREKAQTFDAAILPVEMDPELVERCRRLGIALPQRYEAHPAKDTPTDVGTSEDGTRPQPTSTSEVNAP